MSARSNAWYAENRERRQETMRSYITALTRLGARYPQERLRAYREYRAAGKKSANAQALARASVRDRHRPEFRKILAELRDAG